MEAGEWGLNPCVSHQEALGHSATGPSFQPCGSPSPRLYNREAGLLQTPAALGPGEGKLPGPAPAQVRQTSGPPLLPTVPV
jgi:hypothetical protein